MPDLSGLFPSPLAALVMLTGIALAALARGYTGFGSSALIVASWSLVADPVRAVALALIFEVAASIVQAREVRHWVPWRKVFVVLAAAIAGTPAGIAILAFAPREMLKLGIAIFVLIASVILFAGFRIKKAPGTTENIAIGLFSGTVNGATSMGGLPVALFFTASIDSPQEIRAAMVAYLCLLDIFGIGMLAASGLVTAVTVFDFLIAMPILFAGLWLGGKGFAIASPQMFRKVVLALLITLASAGIIRTILS